VTVPLSTIGYWIKRDLKYTYKKCSTISPDIRQVVHVEHQVASSQQMRRALEEGFYIVYVDETAFTRNEGKQYGFAPKGKKLVFERHKPAYSIGGICAISRYGLEGF